MIWLIECCPFFFYNSHFAKTIIPFGYNDKINQKLKLPTATSTSTTASNSRKQNHLRCENCQEKISDPILPNWLNHRRKNKPNALYLWEKIAIVFEMCCFFSDQISVVFQYYYYFLNENVVNIEVINCSNDCEIFCRFNGQIRNQFSQKRKKRERKEKMQRFDDYILFVHRHMPTLKHQRARRKSNNKPYVRAQNWPQIFKHKCIKRVAQPINESPDIFKWNLFHLPKRFIKSLKKIHPKENNSINCLITIKTDFFSENYIENLKKNGPGDLIVISE